LPRGPATDDGYRLISASTAAGKLRVFPPAKAARRPRIVVRAVRLGRGRFPTDRPGESFPAWLFYVRGVRSPTRVLAAKPFTPPPPTHPHLPSSALSPAAVDTAVVSRGGAQQLTLRFSGAPAGDKPCDAAYSAHSLASQTAIALTITESPVISRSGQGQVCPAVGVLRTILVHLPGPLGHRVLVNASDAEAIPITPA
jgi:hypothetical protein